MFWFFPISSISQNRRVTISLDNIFDLDQLRDIITWSAKRHFISYFICLDFFFLWPNYHWNIFKAPAFASPFSGLPWLISRDEPGLTSTGCKWMEMDASRCTSSIVLSEVYHGISMYIPYHGQKYCCFPELDDGTGISQQENTCIDCYLVGVFNYLIVNHIWMIVLEYYPASS